MLLLAHVSSLLRSFWRAVQSFDLSDAPPSLLSFAHLLRVLSVHSSRSLMKILKRCLLSCSLECIIPELGEGTPQPAFPQDFSKPVCKVCSPDVQGYDSATCFVSSSQDVELHHKMVTLGKAVSNLHLPDQFLVKMHSSSVSLCQFLNLLCQEVVNNMLHKLPALLTACYVGLTVDFRIKSSMRTRTCKFEVSASFAKKAMSTFSSFCWVWLGWS